MHKLFARQQPTHHIFLMWFIIFNLHSSAYIFISDLGLIGPPCFSLILGSPRYNIKSLFRQKKAIPNEKVAQKWWLATFSGLVYVFNLLDRQYTRTDETRKNIFVRNSWLLSRKEKNSFVVRVDALGAR
jgi:hypothetical protein